MIPMYYQGWELLFDCELFEPRLVFHLFFQLLIPNTWCRYSVNIYLIIGQIMWWGSVAYCHSSILQYKVTILTLLASWNLKILNALLVLTIRNFGIRYFCVFKYFVDKTLISCHFFWRSDVNGVWSEMRKLWHKHSSTGMQYLGMLKKSKVF